MIILLSGCVGQKKKVEDAFTGAPVSIRSIEDKAKEDALKDSGSAIRESIKEQDGFGYNKPFIAMRNKEVIDSVWIPTRNISETIKVEGHWVHYVLYKPKWFDDIWFEDPKTTKNENAPFVMMEKGTGSGAQNKSESPSSTL